MTTDRPDDRASDEQAALWNGPAGRAWVQAQVTLDTMFKPFEDLLAHAVPEGFDGQVLDVGCGTGSTTLAMARRLGARGGCTGIDISAPMIAAARARAESGRGAASFVCADAQHHPLAPAGFDRIVSRSA
jgi:ubiquinone/menaquinone biosynthesis C-methylase UbiE